MSHPNITLVGPLTWLGVSGHSELQLGLLSLAAVLEPRGILPQIVDLNLLDYHAIEAEAIATILDTNPDLVGFGSICSSYPLTLRIAAEVKRLRPSITVVLGGPQASVVDQPTMLAFPAIDFIVRGEAERSFPDLIEAVQNKKPFRSIPGISYRSDRRVLRNPNAPVIDDLDQLPLPLYDYYPDLDQRSSLPLEAGRGCPFACRFCSTNDFFRRKFRLKSAGKLVAEMSLLSERYGVREFQLTHDMFTVDRKRVAAFCETLLQQNTRFEWRCSARTDCVDPELLALMARAGCRGIFFGIETGSQRLQHVIDKNLDLPIARRVLQTADRLGIHTTASLITGYPQEASEDLDGTVSFFGDAIALENCDPQLHLLSPLAETPLATEYRDRLIYDRIDSDICGSRDGLHPVDELLVLAHPEIFPNFYALPCPVPREYLQHLRAFLLALSARARGLLLALHRECGGLREVFNAWRQSHPALPPISFYERLEFFENLLCFIEARYLGTGRTGVEVLRRFYVALEAAMLPVVEPSHFPLEETHIHRARNMRIVTVEGDVIRVLAALRNSKVPDSSLIHRICTLAVEVCEGAQNRILELPPLSAAILSFCKEPIGFSELAAALRETLTGARFSEAIEILARQGLIEIQYSAAIAPSKTRPTFLSSNILLEGRSGEPLPASFATAQRFG